MMTKKSVIMCVLTILMIAYCCFALPLTARMARDAHVRGLEVTLSDPQSRFVGVSDVIAESGIDPDTVKRCLQYRFPIGDVESRLRRADKFQSANVSLGADGVVRVYVEPMVPVARVFDTNRPSYYINVEGKSIGAELRYHIDVPVLVGTFDSVHPAHRLLPLLDRIASNPRIGAMVATVTQEPDGNIIIVPTIVGHVVNFGDTAHVDDKFRRLRAFYRHVAPTRGWELYDTVAVKWRGRVVATRRDKAAEPVPIPVVEEQTGELDIDDNVLEPHDNIYTPTSQPKN